MQTRFVKPELTTRRGRCATITHTNRAAQHRIVQFYGFQPENFTGAAVTHGRREITDIRRINYCRVR